MCIRDRVTTDHYGRKIPKHAHGTKNIDRQTSSTSLITNAALELYDRIVDRELLIRRITVVANRLVDESKAKQQDCYEQLNLFTDYAADNHKKAEEEAKLEREKRMQRAMLDIKKKFGKNAIPVSYTHLDVYKRQVLRSVRNSNRNICERGKRIFQFP